MHSLTSKDTSSLNSIIKLSLLIIIFLAETVISVCPASAQYLLVATNQCYRTCPWQAPNNYYSYLPTNTC